MRNSKAASKSASLCFDHPLRATENNRWLIGRKKKRKKKTKKKKQEARINFLDNRCAIGVFNVGKIKYVDMSQASSSVLKKVNEFGTQI